MRFISSTLVAAAAFATAVFASENPIIVPTSDSEIVAGTAFDIKWTPTTDGTITLKLRQGPSDNLKDISTLVSGTANTGTYSWTPDKDLPAGDNYAIMIIDSMGDVNYTPLISIKSDAKASSSAAASSAPASSAPASSAPAVTPEAASASSVPAGVSVTQSWVTATLTKCPSGCVASATGVPTYGNGTSNGTVVASKTPKVSLTEASSTASSGLPVATGAAAMSAVRSPLALIAGVLGAAMFL